MNSEDELLQLGKQWDAAIVRNNADDIATFMADDWVIVGSESGITSKAEFLEWIRSGDVTHTRMESDEIRIKVYGNTGVVTGRGTSAGIYKGQPFDLYEWSSSVFVRDNKKWICVLTMLTPANRRDQ